MGRPSWATKPQTLWLESRMPLYLAARSQATTADFLRQTFQEFLDTWPPTGPAGNEAGQQADTDNKKQKDFILNRITWWYRNHSRGTTSGTGKRAVINLGKKRRKPQAYQAYLQLYGSRIIPLLQDEYAQHCADCAAVGESPNVWIDFLSRGARKMLAKEPADVIKAVDERRSNPNLCGLPVNADETPEQTRVRVRQNAIDAIPQTIQLALKNVHAETDWVGTVMLGGPDPRSGGIKTFIYHHGRTLNAGSEWDQTMNRDDWVFYEESFGAFIPKCYPSALPAELQAVYQTLLQQGEEAQGGSADGNGGNDDSTGNDDEDDGDDDESGAGEDNVDSEDNNNTSGQAGAASTPSVDTTHNDFESERERNIAQNKALLASLDLRLAIGPSSAAPIKAMRPKQKGRASAPASATTKPASKTVTQRISDLQSDTRSSTAHNVADSAACGTISPSGTSLPSPPTAATREAQSSSTSGFPAWMVTALANIKSVSRNQVWQELLEQWKLFESALRFPDGRGKSCLLSKTKRPEEISLWLKCGRKWDSLSTISDAKEFGEAWKAWWVDVQPDWRDLGSPRGQGTDQDWESLRRGGPNAMFLVVLGLAFWLSSLQEDDVKQDVRAAIEDVTWVMKSVVEQIDSQHT